MSKQLFNILKNMLSRDMQYIFQVGVKLVAYQNHFLNCKSYVYKPDNLLKLILTTTFYILSILSDDNRLR